MSAAETACECGKPAFWLGLCRECDAGGVSGPPQTLARLVAYHRTEAAKFASKEIDNSERDGSKYIVGVADWHGQLLPAVLNTETGLTSDAMSRTVAQRRCQALNFFELRGTYMVADCDDAKLLRRLHGVTP